MARRFIIALIIGLVLGLAGVIALNVFVDPTGFARAAGLRDTAFCPGSESHVSDRFSRVLRFQALSPQTVIIGTSRVKKGFHQSTLIESGYTGNLFNFSLNAMTAAEMTDLLPHIARASHVKNLIAGIDHGMFAIREEAARREPIVWTDKEKSLSWTGPFYRAFLTNPVTSASIKSLRSGCHPYSFSIEGFLLPEAGYGRIRFAAQERNQQRVALNYQSMSDLAEPGGALSLFLTALGDACALGPRIDLFIEPAHARLNEVKFTGGWWPDTEDFKRKITGVVAELRGAGCEISITDFSGYNHVTTFPFENGSSPSKYYLDPSHYTRNLGNMIIRRLSGVEKNNPVDSFGVTLTPMNIEAQITRIREERNAYVKAR